MRFTISGRAAGKTRKLLMLMAANPDMIYITATEQMAEEVKRRFRDISPAAQWEERFYSFQKAREVQVGKNVRPCVIDNLDMILPYLLGAGYTIEQVASTGVTDPV